MKAVTFGEIMLRLAPEGYLRFVQADRFGAVYGGGEANVAVSLANYGADSVFVSKLPEHEIGQAALNSLRRFGVDTSRIARGGERIGIYFLEKGASQRPSKVIYDRSGSSFARSVPSDYDWDGIFKNADWFHFTGITPALGANVAEICLEAARAARKRGITVSCDLNYRRKLWSKEEACRTMSEICRYVDVCIANEEDAEDIFGIRAAATDVQKGVLDRGGYISVADQLSKRFGFKVVAVTLRESISASDNQWSAMMYAGERAYFSRRYPIHIVDRVGGGDSFGAGLIYGMLSGWNEQKIIEFAVAASCLKHTVEGDYNMAGTAEVLSLAEGNASGRVQH